MKRNCSCKIVILFFFAVYAVSPIAFGTVARGSGNSTLSGTPSFRTATLYLLQVLYATLADQDRQDEEQSPRHILVVKKKALHRGRADAVRGQRSGAPAGLAALATEGPLVPASEQATPLRTRLRRTGALLPVYSGLSPPALS